MPTYHSYSVRLIDEPRLRAFLLAKGLVPRSLKWSAVRSRVARRFYKD